MNLIDVKITKPPINTPVLLFMASMTGHIDRAEKGYLTSTAGIYSVNFPVTHWCHLPRLEPEQEVYMKIEIEITKVTILKREYGADKVSIKTSLPQPIFPFAPNEPLDLCFDVARGGAEKYLEKNFGITEFEVIEV